MTTPERYNSKEVLCTYVETKNITLYAHGPVGADPFEDFFLRSGSRAMMAYIKPWHWANLTSEYTWHTHILVLRDPVEQHKHASFLHAMSMDQVQRKRENMFYATHLAPHLKTVSKGEFDFYIPFEKLHKYLDNEWQQPSPPAVETGQMFDLGEDIVAYEWIKQNKMELSVDKWNDLVIDGQLQDI